MKKPVTPKSASRFLAMKSGSSLQPLISYASFIRQQDEKLRNGLSEPISNHIALANIRNGVATIIVDSTTWLSKVRYLAPTIQGMLIQHGLQIHKVEFKADPDQRQPRTLAHQPAYMSEATGELLNSFSQSIENTELQAALQRLAKNANKKPPTT